MRRASGQCTQAATRMFIKVTLYVSMLNTEIFPPEADMPYESFLEKTKHATTSAGLVPAL